jgi:hypothetical protein
VTLTTLLQPGWLAVLIAWNFAVLSAAQLTIRLIMAFSVRLTLIAAMVLTAAAVLIAVVFDLAVGPQPSLAMRLSWLPLPMILMALVGFAVARWLLRIRRLRGQIIAGCMVGLLDPHVFTLLST